MFENLKEDQALKINGFEQVACPLCDSRSYITVRKGIDYLFSQKEFLIVRCMVCGVHFTNPRVKRNQIGPYYPSDYLPSIKAKRFRKDNNIKRRLVSLLGGVHIEVMRTLKRNNVKTVLEIGPGNGSLLYYLRDHGLKVFGVDTDIKNVQGILDEGIPCYHGDLNEVMDHIELKKVDAVILCHVFEHLYDPRKTLENIYAMLNNKGLMYLSVPNCKSNEAKIFGKYWRGYDLPRHIVHYDEKTIRAVLDEAGFDVLALRSENFPSSLVESLGFLLFKNRKMPYKLYCSIYYPWKLLGLLMTKAFGSGVMTIIAKKRYLDYLE